MTEVASLVVFAAEPEEPASFYRAAGIALADEQHDDGPVHFAVEVGSVHVAIYAATSEVRATGFGRGGSTFPGFHVESLDSAMAEFTRLGATFLKTHEEMP